MKEKKSGEKRWERKADSAQISQVFKNKRRFFAHDFDDFSRFRPLILNRDLFLNVLDSIRDKPKTVLWFFRWVNRQPGFHPSEASFFAVLEILAEKELMRPAYFVAEQAVSLKLHGIVDFLIDGCISSDVSAKLLDLFLWIYTKESMVELSLSTFNKMGRNGLAKLMVSTYNAFIGGLCKRGRMVEAQDRRHRRGIWLFDNLTVNHLSPTVVTYNTLIDGLCRVGALEEARKLKDEMCELGLLPDVITYTSLVNGSCKIGDLVSAKGFFDEMLGKGLQPDCFAYTARIAGELKLGSVFDAFHLREEMLTQGVLPNLITYNVLVDGLCKLVDLEEAYSLIQ
ncbi:hypothetical protein AAC387_Pa03g0434 [Persea americana]